MNIKLKKKKKQKEKTEASSGSGGSPLKKRKTGTDKKGDTDGPDHKKRRTERAGDNSIKGKQAGPKQPVKDGKPKYDLGKGRSLHPVKDANGNTVFLPKESDATGHEKKKGLFVADESVAAPKPPPKTPVKDGKPKYDLGKGRMLHPAKDADGNTVFLPKESDATEHEISKGLFVADDSVAKPKQDGKEAIKDQKPNYDLGKGRMLYPAKDANGKTVFLPKESEATDHEKSQGIFVTDASVPKPKQEGKKALKNGKPKYDLGKGRTLYPVEDATGKVVYLPKEGDATDFEITKGLFVADNTNEDDKRNPNRKPADNNERKEARAERAARLAGNKVDTSKKSKYDLGKGRKVFPVTNASGKTIYLPKEGDATDHEKSQGLYIPEGQGNNTDLTDPGKLDLGRQPITEAKDGTKLWDGKSLPQPTEAQKKHLLAGLKPKYDPDKKRMLFPVDSIAGKQHYLPLKEEATTHERNTGQYANIVPDQPLQDFVQQRLSPQSYEVEGGTVMAFSRAQIEEAFAKENNLRLMVQSDLQEVMDKESALQQQWVD